MIKRGKIPTGVIILLMIVAVAIIGFVIYHYTKPVGTDDIVKKDFTSHDITFYAYWRGTNPTCSSFKDTNYNGELTFNFESVNSDPNQKCEVYVDNQTTGNTFLAGEKIDENDNEYLGLHKVSREHTAKVCCGEVCRESVVKDLCVN